MTEHQHIIAKILGPTGVELDCDLCFDLLDEYVEDVASGAHPKDAHPQLHAHLESCPVCQEEFDSLHELVRTDDSQAND